jgi:hypothetical protein
MKRRLAIFYASFAALFAVLVWLTIAVHFAFMFALMFCGAFFFSLLMAFSCPRCGASVLYRPHSAFGLTVNAFSFWPTECPECQQHV